MLKNVYFKVNLYGQQRIACWMYVDVDQEKIIQQKQNSSDANLKILIIKQVDNKMIVVNELKFSWLSFDFLHKFMFTWLTTFDSVICSLEALLLLWVNLTFF